MALPKASGLIFVFPRSWQSHPRTCLSRRSLRLCGCLEFHNKKSSHKAGRQRGDQQIPAVHQDEQHQLEGQGDQYR